MVKMFGQTVKLDPWQEEVMKVEGNLHVRSGRQSGKSFVVSMKAAEYAVKNPRKTVMVIASVERQSFLLFDKILNYLVENYKSMIMKGKDRPTKHKITLINGSVIYSLPTGMSGYGIRGFTVDLLIADEAAFIPEDVWTAVTPMLAVTKGKIWLLSTPFGRSGYFYEMSKNEKFTHFHVSSEDCPRRDDDFLKSEKERMTKVQYAQEYLGEFVDELMQFFPNDLIRKCMTIKDRNQNPFSNNKFMGVDVARKGGDEFVIVGVNRVGKDRITQFDLDVMKDITITEGAKKILIKDKQYNYKKIYLDDGGLGVGVFDILMENQQTKRKTEALNNSARSLDNEDKRMKKILKEDLYTNLLRLMEQGKIELFDDENLFLSLTSVQYEITDDKTLKIFGRYTHIAEALIRAAWCIKDKHLNIYIY